MSSPTIFLKKTPLEKPNPKYWVYYDDWTGEITNVANRHYDHIDDPYITTDSSVAVDLMRGKINYKKYVVAELVEGLTLIEKDKAIRLKKQEEILSLIPDASPTISDDVNIIFYKSNWLLEVNLNQDTILRLTGKRFNKKFSRKENSIQTKIILFLTEKNNPLNLYETIEIDPIELINKGYILIDLKHLNTKTTPHDISFLTRRIFKNYGLKFKESYDTVDYHSRKRCRRKYTQIREKSSDWSTFSVSPSTEGWILKSNFDDPHTEKIYTDIKIFLFDNTPFGLLDKIIIPYEKLGNRQEFLVKTKVDPTKCNLLIGEDNIKISFKFEEIEYVKSGKY